MKKLLGVLLVSMLLFTGCSSDKENNGNDKPQEENKASQKVSDIEKDGWKIYAEDFDGTKEIPTIYLSKDDANFKYEPDEASQGGVNTVEFQNTGITTKGIFLNYIYLLDENVPETVLYTFGNNISVTVNGSEEGSFVSERFAVKDFDSLEVWKDTSNFDMNEEIDVQKHEKIIEESTAFKNEHIADIQKAVKLYNSSLKELGFKDFVEVRDFMKEYYESTK